MAQQNFYNHSQTRNENGLADFLGISRELLYETAANCRAGISYNEFRKRKTDGTWRKITVPTPFLKQLQEAIRDGILKGVPVSTRACAYVQGRSTLTHASYHKQKAVVANLDIQSFFPSCSRAKVFKIFAGLGWCMKASWLLADLCCYQGGLPQGTCTSPYLSNLILLKFDNDVIKFSNSLGVAYSRYSDDMSFSANDVLDVLKAVEYAKIQLAEYGFKVNENKSTIAYSHERQDVTGLTVNTYKPQPPKITRRRARAIMHSYPNSPKAQGWRAYLQQFEGGNSE